MRSVKSQGYTQEEKDKNSPIGDGIVFSIGYNYHDGRRYGDPGKYEQENSADIKKILGLG